MQPSIISLFLQGLSIARWSNFPRLHTNSALDHTAFSLHIAFLIADLMEEKWGEKLDRISIFKRAIFSLAFTCTYSDVNSDIKSRIRSTRPDLYKKLCDNVSARFSDFSMPESVRKELEQSAKNLSVRDTEAELYSYAKLVSAYLEAMEGARMYPEAYSKALSWIRSRLYSGRFDAFRSLLDADIPSPEMLFLFSVRRLSASFRWNRMRRNYPISVMSHLFLVAVFAFILSRDEKWDDDTTRECITRALFHDLPEAITGDIITPTKKSVHWLEELIGSIEREVVDETLLRHLSGHTFLDRYRANMLDPWSTDTWKLVKQADLFSAYVEAKIEELSSFGNVQSIQSGKLLIQRLSASDFPSVKRLLTCLADGGVQVYVPDIV